MSRGRVGLGIGGLVLGSMLAACGEEPAHRSAVESPSEVSPEALAQPPSAGVQRVETEGHAPDTLRPGDGSRTDGLATGEGPDPGADRWVPLAETGPIEPVEVRDPSLTDEAAEPPERP